MNASASKIEYAFVILKVLDPPPERVCSLFYIADNLLSRIWPSRYVGTLLLVRLHHEVIMPVEVRSLTWGGARLFSICWISVSKIRPGPPSEERNLSRKCFNGWRDGIGAVLIHVSGVVLLQWNYPFPPPHPRALRFLLVKKTTFD